MRIWDDEIVKELYFRLSSKERAGLEVVVRALREAYPKIDVYQSILGGGAAISAGKRSKGKPKGRPLFSITKPRRNKPSCVRIRIDSKKDREKLADAVGRSWDDINETRFKLSSFPGALAEFKVFLTDLSNSIDVIRERSNGHGYLPSDYQDIVNCPTETENEEDFPEGARLKVFVNRYERSRKARTACIAKHGASCFFCGFDYGERYGDAYSGFIHVHHIVPISKIGKKYKVNFEKDLVPVCPNCHAVIHFGGETLSLDEAKRVLSPNNGT
ncbi:HNH endonuclease [Vreelandella sp. H-I2]